MTRDEDVVALLEALPPDLPTTVRFGGGVRRTVGDVAAAYGRRTVVIRGRSARTTAAGRETLEALPAAGIRVVDEVVIEGEPDDRMVRGVVERLAETSPDSIVAIGGGSPIDLAKASAQRPTPERLARLLAGERTEMPGLPVIALPTTAGTGAETSHAAIVLDRSADRKRGVRGIGVACRDALVDPELMAGAPAAVIAIAGFDAIAHAVETSASRVADEAAIERAGLALRVLLDVIPSLHGDGDGFDLRAWSAAAAAATLMGVNLARSSTCLPHRLQYPVGARTATPHGAGVAALFPAWLTRTVALAPAPLARLARRAALADEDTDDATAAQALADAVLAHLHATGMRRSLRDLGVEPGDVESLVDAVEGSVANDPGPTTRDDLRGLYVASL